MRGDDVLPGLHGKRRDADLAEAEMIGAVVMALLRLGIGCNRQIHRFGDLLGGRIERRALGAVQHDVAHAA